MKTACPVSKKCGSCCYTGMDYAEQLKLKQKKLDELLGGFAAVEPIIGMKDPLHYRAKVHHVFDRDRRGNVISGSYEAGTHKVVDIRECLIEDEECQAVIASVRKLVRSFKIKIYDEDTGVGLLRHVLVRRGIKTGEIMVVLVLSSQILPGKNNFVKALRTEHPQIKTVVINVNDSDTSMVLGEKENVIYGPGYITDELCGLRFRISPKSFYQVNPRQTEKLYGIAMDFARLKKSDIVIDAYCGTGTIGLAAASKTKEVIAVELNPDAVKDARINASANGIKNARFVCADAGAYMNEMASAAMKPAVALHDGQKAHEESAAEKMQISDSVLKSANSLCSVVFMDPPRSGSTEKFMRACIRMQPQRIVYISCGPESLKRDLGFFKKNGYTAKRIQPVDLFPFTEHVETVCLMSRVDK